jgi:hypothetical protein
MAVRREDSLLSFDAGTLCNPPSAKHTLGDPQLRRSTNISNEIEIGSVNAIFAWSAARVVSASLGKPPGRVVVVRATDLHEILEEGVTSTSTYHMRDI